MAAFIAGDWGSTNLRLFLCDAQGKEFERRLGPGAIEVRGDFAGSFDSLTSDWMQRWGPLRAILSGMVGSSVGWIQTPYIESPANAEQLARACAELRGGAIRIVPGLSSHNRLGAPDLMRGEETQVLGVLELDPELRRGRHMLCFPGTHTKWVMIEDGSIAEFLTVPAGELYALICRHSVLVQNEASTSLDVVAFERGVAEFARDPRVQLLHRVFQCRSRWMTGDLAAESTASYLSGLLIACDIYGALELLGANSAKIVHVIGSKRLTHLYSKVFARVDRQAHCFDGETSALAGLAHIDRLLQDNHAA